MALRDRLAKLETRNSSARGWHIVRRYSDQTEEQAIAVYEASNGPIGPEDGSILLVIINKPFPAS